MKKDFLAIFLLLLPAVAPLIRPGYFTMHDDLQTLRQLEMNKCFADGQIPCRWVPDMGYGYGFPLFNYYPPLPYLIGQVYRYAGLSYMDIVKAVGITGFIAAALFMYLLGREFWGRGGGVVSALFYTYAPYHSVDFYVRGAMNEFWALVFYPAIFWTTYKLISKSEFKWIPWVALSLAGLMLSHNLMLMIFIPVFLVWILFWWWRFHSLSSVKPLAIAAPFAFGLAAFFTLPVLFEQKFVHVDTLISGYFNYLQHFVPISRIFINVNWGYGASNLGQTEALSFHLGYLQWLVPLLLILLLPFVRRLRTSAPLLIFLVAVTLVSVFMAHARSSFIWVHLPPLAYLQFPWRFLTLAIFSSSFLSGAVALAVSRRIIPLFLFGVIILNTQYFHPREWLPNLTDAQKFSGASWLRLTDSAIFDYLPIWAPQPPADSVGSDLNITHGSGQFTRLAKRSAFQSYKLDISTPTAVVELQTFYFPGWRVWLDGQEKPILPRRDPLLGRIQVDLPSGSHSLVAKFTNTPVRLVGDLFSLATWGVLIILSIRFVLYKLHKRI